MAMPLVCTATLFTKSALSITAFVKSIFLKLQVVIRVYRSGHDNHHDGYFSH
ncbi:hypothetical protein HMPREF0454_00358 [Hafnia alvei ATCC 51873]|uniref:Uncharacterized protein n=1 Tax=Hafnia alvei ATCC 51873 TaxID=1002364 RepID=G9Y1E1_HAFAL|nr:hypothetical protein HMPREF0454_00358 [Hafnia alvei ATCC 51873]